MKAGGVWAVTALVLALVAAVSVQSWRLWRAQMAEVKARAERQGKALVDADWLKGIEASQRELAEIVPALQEQLDVAKKEQARLLLATRFEGKADTIRVPVVSSATAAPGSRGAPSPPDAPAGEPGAATSPGTDIDTWVRLDEAIVADDVGGIYIARTVDVQLQAGDWYSGWKPVKPTKLEATKPHVDPELTKAWAAWKAPKPPRVEFGIRPPGQWRGGWSCLAGGGVLVTGATGAGFFCGWGPQL